MRKQACKLLAGALLLLTAEAAQAAAREYSKDEAAIRRVVAGLEEAWNRHDMKAWANLFTEDADFVNVTGRWWKGRAEIQRQHVDAHAVMFRDSTLKIDEVAIRFLKPDVALVHVRWNTVGDKTADGSPRPPRTGIFTQVLVEQKGRWLVAGSQNTNAQPERPFPTK